MALVSFVIPTLKEEDIGEALTRLGEHLSKRPGYSVELLLADDSPESYKAPLDAAIAAFVARFGPRQSARRVDGPRLGKGAAVRVGVLASRGDYVFTMDADLPVPLPYIDLFLGIFEEQGVDLVVAERAFDRNLSQPVRFVASRGLYLLQRFFVFQSNVFNDTQCGFKAFRGQLVRRLAAAQIVDGGMVDIEYLYASVKTGARIANVPVMANPETRESKINVRKAIWTDPVNLFRVKLRGIVGRYG